MTKKRTDDELIKIFLSGDQDAFEELISRYSAKAFSLATRLTGSREDAEEVLQDAFVTVYRKIGGFEGKSQFSSWFYRVTVNAALMKLRKRRQNPAVSLEDIYEQNQTKDIPAQTGSADRDGDSATLRSEVSSALDKAVRSLPEDYKPVFILRDVDGLSSEEVSNILGLTIPAVKSRLHRARTMLRKRLAPFYKEITGNKELVELQVGNI